MSPSDAAELNSFIQLSKREPPSLSMLSNFLKKADIIDLLACNELGDHPRGSLASYHYYSSDCVNLAAIISGSYTMKNVWAESMIHALPYRKWTRIGRAKDDAPVCPKLT